ncbi:MAG TPA: DUF1326 domain-containing protein [Bacteroidota bacterium]|nr:DUF1326 domain-containing protein [Bacteroidota bacterium]
MANQQQTPWEIEAEYIQSCNCDYGCPCNFNALPTHGNCEALVAYRIRKGHFGGTKLDGVTFAMGLWWPKAIHEGNGIGALYVDTKTTPEQLAAIEAIGSGKNGGGVFEIFPQTFKEVHPTKRTKIDFHYNDYDSWFTVEGVGEVHSEHIKNPVTGDAFTGTIQLPGGIGWKNAIVSNIRKWWIKDGNITAEHQNKNGHVSLTRFSNAGCIG